MCPSGRLSNAQKREIHCQTQVGVKELLEAGVHFGHQTRRWHPKMRRYIFGERDGIYIIDLLKTVELLERARAFVEDLSSKGGDRPVRRHQEAGQGHDQGGRRGRRHALRSERWLGGLLTNFNTMKKRIERLHELSGSRPRGSLELLPTKERMSMEAELDKLETNLGGVAEPCSTSRTRCS